VDTSVASGWTLEGAQQRVQTTTTSNPPRLCSVCVTSRTVRELHRALSLFQVPHGDEPGALQLLRDGATGERQQ